MPAIRVAAAVVVKERTVLIARRKAGTLMSGYWEFPGGKIEPNESPEACLVRELKEEFSVVIRVGRFLGTSHHSLPERTIELHAYWAEHVSGSFLPVDHDAFEWVSPEKLESYRLAPADLPFIPLVQAGLAE